MSNQKYFQTKYLSREDYLKLPLKERFIPLSSTESDRANALQEKLIKIDLHCHGVIYYPYTYMPHLSISPPSPSVPVFPDARIPLPLSKELSDYMKGLRDYTLETYLRHYKINWEGLKAAGITGIQQILGGATENYEAIIVDMGIHFADVRKNPLGKVAYCAEDIRQAKREGKIAFMAASEANPFSNVLDRVNILYGLGLRQTGMTFEQSNYTACGASDPKNGGLTPFGAKIVERMNELGMIIDLSHSSRQTTMNAIEASEDPVTLSHNGASGIYKGNRCRSDEELKALAEKRGIIGISGVPNALSDSNRQGIKNWFEHADYCVRLMGIEHVAVGLDVNWQDHVGMHKMTGLRTELPSDYMEGIENPTEGWHNIIRILVSEGYSDQEIEKITGANALQLIEKVIG